MVCVMHANIFLRVALEIYSKVEEGGEREPHWMCAGHVCAVKFMTGALFLMLVGWLILGPAPFLDAIFDRL